VPAAKADEYLDYPGRTGLSDYAETRGNRAVIVFRRTENGVTHFLLTTLWESWEAIEREPFVTHVEVPYCQLQRLAVSG